MAAAPRVDHGSGAGGGDPLERDRRILALELALKRAREEVLQLRRNVGNMEEIVDARGERMGVLERKYLYWRDEAMRRGELMDAQSRRMLVLEQEREGLRLMLDQEYVRIGADLEVEAVGEAGYLYGVVEGPEGGVDVGGGGEGDVVVVAANEEGAVVGFGGEVVDPGLLGGGGDGGDGGDGGELLEEEGEAEAEDIGFVTCVEND
jgi:hypothetical protein